LEPSGGLIGVRVDVWHVCPAGLTERVRPGVTWRQGGVRHGPHRSRRPHNHDLDDDRNDEDRNDDRNDDHHDDRIVNHHRRNADQKRTVGVTSTTLVMPYPLGLFDSAVELTVWGDARCSLRVSADAAWRDAVRAITFAHRLELIAYVGAATMIALVTADARSRSRPSSSRGDGAEVAATNAAFGVLNGDIAAAEKTAWSEHTLSSWVGWGMPVALAAAAMAMDAHDTREQHARTSGVVRVALVCAGITTCAILVIALTFIRRMVLVIAPVVSRYDHWLLAFVVVVAWVVTGRVISVGVGVAVAEYV
jgi:hypothetical protein